MALITTRLLPKPAPARVLACGAWLKNTACLIDGHQVHWSPLHDDLGDPAHCAKLDASIEALLAMAGGRVDAVAHDLHPDFHSTHAAQQLAARLGVPAIGVQHHHAHIAVAQAEQGLQDAVVGLALDGVGLGTDGHAWGGEMLLVHGAPNGAQWSRLAHLPELMLPGGDVAAREPWRMAASALHRLGHCDEIEARLSHAVGTQAARTVRAMLDRKLNCPISTSAGRWFDAVAGLLGVSVRQSHEAEAAIALEQLATGWLARHPDFNAPHESLDLLPVIDHLLQATRPGVELEPPQQAQAAAYFHVALSNGLIAAAQRAAYDHGARTVVLGGGCFLNRVLTQRVTEGLQQLGLQVIQPTTVSCGDAGLALGQAWIAAHTAHTLQTLASPSET